MNAAVPDKVNQRPARETTARKAILVLGMHRSGTSAVTRCLNLLGAEVGDTLLPPADDNQPGFWEHSEVVSIHEDLLRDLGRVWSDARALPREWQLSVAARRACSKLVKLLRKDFSGGPLWVVKDPRLSRFVPLWREVLAEVGTEAVALLVVRHPAEVAQSLNIRDGLPPETTYLNWLEHFAEAEIETRSMPRCLVSYDGLLSDWRGAFTSASRALCVEWPEPIEGAHPAIEAFLDGNQRHHVFSRDFHSMPEVLDRLYALCRAFESGAQDWTGISGLVDSYRLMAPPFLDLMDRLLGDVHAFEDKASRIEKTMGTALNEIEKAVKAAKSISNPVTSAGDYAALYYRSAGQEFVEQRVCIRNYKWEKEDEKTFRFELPSGQAIASIRFDPSCEVGAFNIDWLKVNDEFVSDLRARVRAVNQYALDRQDGAAIWLASNDNDPWIEFDVSDLVKSGNEPHTIEVCCRRRQVEGVLGALTASFAHGLQHDLSADIIKSGSPKERQLAKSQGELLQRVEALQAQAAKLDSELATSREREVRLQQHVDELRAHRAQLESDLAASRKRADQVQRETFCVTARSIDLSNQLEAAWVQNSDRETRYQGPARGCVRLGSNRVGLDSFGISSQQELVEIKSSTLWRVLVVLRSILLLLPWKARRTLRLAIRTAWWTMTPWRVPTRFRFFRERRIAARLPATPPTKPERLSFETPVGKMVGPGHDRSPLSLAAYAYAQPEAEPALIGKSLLALSRPPFFSVVVPVYNTDPALLRRAIASVEHQWYPHWELILVDDHSVSGAVHEVLDGLADSRMVVVKLAENKCVSGATNEGIARASGDFIVFLDHDDELTVDCLHELAQRIDRDDPDYLYSDEDKLDVDGGFRDPFFKPDWSPDTLMSTMFTCHVSCVRRALAIELGGLRSEYDGSQDWDFVLRLSERTRRIAHIPKVLYHWRITPESCASGLDVKPYAIDASKRAREDALRRRNQSGELVSVPELPGYFRTRYRMRGHPLISIIIPSKNNGAVLKACIDSIFARTAYRQFEVVVINNGSTDEQTLDYLSGLRRQEQVRVVDHDVPFNFSEINNFGVRHSRGELLVFLNDDTEVLSADWLETMGGYAQLPHVGAVGAKLLYPGSRTVQHAGVLNLTNGPCHAFVHIRARDPGYFTRNMLEHDWIAVTGACLMLERKKFEAVDGFDEDLAVTYNDVALCFSLTEQGFYQVVCPGVELLHHESLSRGRDTLDRARMARLDRERGILFGKHPGFYDNDPFHNPNLAPDNVYFGLRQ